jgi:hypothetical protein
MPQASKEPVKPETISKESAETISVPGTSYLKEGKEPQQKEGAPAESAQAEKEPITFKKEPEAAKGVSPEGLKENLKRGAEETTGQAAKGVSTEVLKETVKRGTEETTGSQELETKEEPVEKKPEKPAAFMKEAEAAKQVSPEAFTETPAEKATASQEPATKEMPKEKRPESFRGKGVRVPVPGK